MRWHSTFRRYNHYEAILSDSTLMESEQGVIHHKRVMESEYELYKWEG